VDIHEHEILVDHLLEFLEQEPAEGREHETAASGQRLVVSVQAGTNKRCCT